MKPIIIPTILTATILLAGFFAFMPIEKATAVHTTILANTPTLKASANAKAQASAAATTYTWTVTGGPMKIVGIKGAELAQTAHTTTVITITGIDGAAILGGPTFATQSSAAAAHTYFIGEGEGVAATVPQAYQSTIAGVGASGVNWSLPINAATSFTITVVTTAATATVTNTYTLLAETGGTIVAS